MLFSFSMASSSVRVDYDCTLAYPNSDCKRFIQWNEIVNGAFRKPYQASNIPSANWIDPTTRSDIWGDPPIPVRRCIKNPTSINPIASIIITIQPIKAITFSYRCSNATVAAHAFAMEL